VFKTKKYFSFLIGSFILITVAVVLFFGQIQIIGSQSDSENSQNFEVIENECLEEFLTTVEGISSYYSRKFHNRKTASGEKFDMFGFTAAHRRLPFGTIVKVENLNNGKTVLVRINDRGPFTKGRIIDVSYRAMKEIDGLRSGVPKATIHYFDEKNVIENFDNSYFLCYSLQHPFNIIRKENAVIVDEATDFEEAMNKFYSLEEQNEFPIYLFVEAGKTQRNPKFFIGYLNLETVNGVETATVSSIAE